MRQPALALAVAAAIASALPNPVAVSLATTNLAADRIAAAGQRILAAYPEHIARVDDAAIVWHDGTRMALDDGIAGKTPEGRLTSADLEDMLADAYPPGDVDPASPPPPASDPGRARNRAFFDKMYGDCRSPGFAGSLVAVPWIETADGRPTSIVVTRINGIDRRLAAVRDALKALGPHHARFLTPPAGGSACRTIAGTDRRSMHAYAAAIDIAPASADYWRWQHRSSKVAPPPAWRNRIPPEIVRVFESNGFIWGGKWSHYDTMHFEYRPELLAPVSAAPPR